MYLFRAVDALRAAPLDSGLDAGELADVQGRLVLSNQMLGGLVSSEHASEAWSKRRHGSAAARGHNWELLRQSAEQNGLYFQPIRLGSEHPHFAMLWFEQGAPPRGFDGKFLNVADPYRDHRLACWKGYSETWYFAEDGERVSEPGEGVRAARVAPLALYALDHPRVPLLLVDFRDPGKMKKREMALRFSDELATGVFGFTGWGNWPYMTAKSGWFFIHGRHGGAMDRSARVRAYVQLRQGLLMDRSLAPGMRAELTRRTDHLGWNPLDQDLEREAQVARAQYAALVHEASSAMEEDLERERLGEIRAGVHSRRARAGLRLASMATLGLYRHHETSSESVAQVDTLRRAAAERLERAFLSALPPPQPVATGGGQ